MRATPANELFPEPSGADRSPGLKRADASFQQALIRLEPLGKGEGELPDYEYQNLKQAITELDETARLYEQAGEPASQADALFYAAIAILPLEPDTASALFDQAEGLYVEHGLFRRAGRLSAFRATTGSPNFYDDTYATRAAEFFERAEQLNQNTDDIYAEMGAVNFRLAEIALENHDFNAAIDLYDKAISFEFGALIQLEAGRPLRKMLRDVTISERLLALSYNYIRLAIAHFGNQDSDRALKCLASARQYIPEEYEGETASLADSFNSCLSRISEVEQVIQGYSTAY